MVGVPFDTGVTYRAGGRFGPNGVRAASVMLRPYNTNLEVAPFEILSCVDYGDVAIVPGYIERSYEAIEQAVAPIVEAGVVPLLIGGDHACTLPHLRATRSRGPVAVIDFDSHTDAWDSYFGEKYNHGTWMRRAIEEGLVDVAHSIEVGLRGGIYEAADWTGLRDELGLDYLTTEEVLDIGPAATADRIRSRVGGATAFISFDIDVVDPAFAPGTGTPEPGGLSAARCPRDRPATDRHRLHRVRRRRGDPGLRPGRSDGVPGGEPRLRDAVARRAPASPSRSAAQESDSTRGRRRRPSSAPAGHSARRCSGLRPGLRCSGRVEDPAGAGQRLRPSRRSEHASLDNASPRSSRPSPSSPAAPEGCGHRISRRPPSAVSSQRPRASRQRRRRQRRAHRRHAIRRDRRASR